MKPISVVGVGCVIALAVGCGQAQPPAPAPAAPSGPIDQPIVLNGTAVAVDDIRQLLITAFHAPGGGDDVCSYQVLGQSLHEAYIHVRCETYASGGGARTQRSDDNLILRDMMAVDGTHYYAIRGGHSLTTAGAEAFVNSEFPAWIEPQLHTTAESSAARDHLLDLALASQKAALGSRE